MVVSSLDDGAITLSLRLWVAGADYWGVMFMLNECARDRLAAVGVQLAQPRIMQLQPAS